jgi:hypothetical protein
MQHQHEEIMGTTCSRRAQKGSQEVGSDPGMIGMGPFLGRY